MKKLIFFMTFLIFTRIGMGLGISATPVGIGNFFLGAPSITESNLNQVLGLLVGADGQPGAAGISGANGLNGLNGTPGVPGAQGLPGIQGVKGDPGIPGTPGIPGKDGGVGSVGLGGGAVAIKTCDDTVNISVAQKFMRTFFGLDKITVSDIDATECSGFDVTIYLEVTDPANPLLKRTVQCTATNIAATEVFFDIPTCTGAAIKMDDLGSTIGLEFIKPV
jgi:hypothetical protein